MTSQRGKAVEILGVAGEVARAVAGKRRVFLDFFFFFMVFNIYIYFCEIFHSGESRGNFFHPEQFYFLGFISRAIFRF